MMLPSEAIAGFAAWLTEQKPATLGRGYDRGVAAYLVELYCEAQGWQPPRPGYEALLRSAPSDKPLGWEYVDQRNTPSPWRDARLPTPLCEAQAQP